MENIVRLSPYETYSKETAFRDRLTEGRHALNVEIEVRILAPKLWHGRVAHLAEHLSDMEEEAGSIPAPPTFHTRASSSERPSACLTNKRSLVRFQPRPLAWS